MSWLYWLVTFWLLNMGLVPEQNAMKTCVEISETVARRMGRASLVVDYRGGDFTPTPLFLGLINDAHHWLDLHYRPDQPLERVEAQLLTGDYLVNVPRLKHVQRIDMEIGSARHELDRLDLAALRRLYPQPWADVETGRPLYWARAVGEWAVEPVAAVELIENGGFDDGLDGWSLDQPGSWSVEDGVAVFQGVEVGQNPAMRMSLVPAVSGATELSLDLVIGEGQVFVSDVSFAYQTTVSESGKCTITIPSSASINGIYIIPQSVDAVVSVDNVFLGTPAVPGVPADLITMPPADQAYMLHVFGSRYSAAMVSNTDVTWWSDKHPNILQKAIRREVEMELNRNPTEAEKIGLEIRSLMRQVESNEVQERSSAEADDWRIMP